jgi:hypothetical protein
MVTTLTRRVAGLLAVVILIGAPAAAWGAWRPGMKRAISYSAHREGDIGFAVVGPAGHLYRHRASRRVPAASVLKVMFMTAYLRRPSVRDRGLRRRDRRLLRPMIRRSDNDAATTIADILGPKPMKRLARAAGMKHFSYTRPWGLSTVSARDQARFMSRLERYIPDRHEAYARRQLANIVARQRWGVARIPRGRYALYFKSGWGSGTGRISHQVAFLERGERRVAVAIMTEHNPSHAYSKRTLRGIAKRLLGDLP